MLHLNCLQALNRQGTCTKHVRCNSLIPPPCIGIKTLPAQTQCIRCPPCPPTQRRPKRALVCVGSSKNVDASDNSHDHNNQHANRDIKAAHSEFTLKRRSVGRPALSVSSSTTGPDGKGFAPVSRPGPGESSDVDVRACTLFSPWLPAIGHMDEFACTYSFI